jgi:tRNA pseudouridine38-40 synthase
VPSGLDALGKRYYGLPHMMTGDTTDTGTPAPDAIRSFRVLLAYEGRHYKGWQIQPDQATVQGAVEDALGGVLGAFTRIHASGRTDTGVSALGQVIHFLTERWAGTPADLEARLKAALPADIVVRALDEVPADFHARYSAKRKHYRYTVCNTRRPWPGPVRPDVYYFGARLEIDRMREAARRLVGTNDFSSFGVNPGRVVETPVKTLTRCDISHDPPFIIFDLEADGFLYKMVRSIVGTLLKVGVGAIEPEAITTILDARDRSAAGPTAPPYGLCLMQVFYDE